MEDRSIDKILQNGNVGERTDAYSSVNWTDPRAGDDRNKDIRYYYFSINGWNDSRAKRDKDFSIRSEYDRVENARLDAEAEFSTDAIG